jgi:ATP-binding cassette subfamily B protein
MTLTEIINLVVGFCFCIISSICSNGDLCQFIPAKVGDYLYKQIIGEAITVDFAYYENPVYHDTLHLVSNKRY